MNKEQDKPFKAILEEKLKKHGKDAVLDYVQYLSEPQPLGGGSGKECPTGYYYSETLKRCVLDIG